MSGEKKCFVWWHKIFHLFEGNETSRSKTLMLSDPYTTDYCIDYYSCWLCKAKWVVDRTKEEQEFEMLRDQTFNHTIDHQPQEEK